MTLLIIIIFRKQSASEINNASSSKDVGDVAEDPPPRKKPKPSKATKLEQQVMQVPTLLELDKEISEYKGCAESYNGFAMRHQLWKTWSS